MVIRQRSHRFEREFQPNRHLRYTKFWDLFAKTLLFREEQMRLSFLTQVSTCGSSSIPCAVLHSTSWKQFLCPRHIVRLVASRMSSHSWKSACSYHIDLAIPLSWYHVIMATRCSVVYTHWPVVFKNVKYSPKHTKQTLLRIATFDVSIIHTVSTATFDALCRIAWSYKSVIISRVYCMNLYLFIVQFQWRCLFCELLVIKRTLYRDAMSVRPCGLSLCM